MPSRPDPFDLRSALAGLASRRPHEPALAMRGVEHSFSRIARGVEATERLLGQVAGVRALAVLPDGPEAYVAHLAFFLGGGTLVPLSVGAPTAYLASVAERVRPHVIVTTPALRRKHLSLFTEYPCLLAEPDREACFSWASSGVTGSRPSSSRLASDVRLILFTSGSTGLPKGVCLSERNLLSAAAMNVAILALDEGRRSLLTVPLYDYYGLIQIYSHLMVGAGLCLGESVAFVADLHARLVSSGATDLVGVPYGLRKVFPAAGRAAGGVVPPSLKRVQSSSDVLSEDVLAAIFAARPDLVVVNVYGLTEAGRACSREIRAGEAWSQSIGRPSPEVEIVIEAAGGVPGELVIRGPNVMLGYLKEVTSGSEIRYEPCVEVRTGDLGFVHAGGEVFLVGRKDHLLNLKGVKVHPVEIETVALRTPGVTDARAYLDGRADGEPALCLELVSESADPVLDLLKARLRAELPAHCQPAELRRVPSIARTELGSKTVRS